MAGDGADTEEEEKNQPGPLEKMKRRGLVEEARRRHLKVGKKTTLEIREMLSKDRRSQPRVTDLLTPWRSSNPTTPSQRPSWRAKREILILQDPAVTVIINGDTMGKSSTKTEGVCPQPDGEEDKCVSKSSNPNSVMPIVQGESQEGVGKCLPSKAGIRALGSALQNTPGPPKIRERGRIIGKRV